MIIVVGGIKGGSGKTTIATNLAVLRSAAGKKVLLVDADEQKSAFDWSEQREHRANNALKPKYTFVTVCLSGRSVYTQIKKMKEDYDDIVIDTGGRDTTSQRAALNVADIFLIPFKPRSIDIWTMGGVKRLINEVQACNPILRCFVFINQADPKGSDNQDALNILCDYHTDVNVLPLYVGNRKAFSNAAAEGLAVSELDTKDIKASKEIIDLYNSLYQDDVDSI